MNTLLAKVHLKIKNMSKVSSSVKGCMLAKEHSIFVNEA